MRTSSVCRRFQKQLPVSLRATWADRAKQTLTTGGVRATDMPIVEADSRACSIPVYRGGGLPSRPLRRYTCCNLWAEFYVLIGTRRIRVVRPNMRVTNGVVHIIEEVVFDPTDLETGRWISRASRCVDSLSVVLLSLLSLFVRCLFPWRQPSWYLYANHAEKNENQWTEWCLR